LIGKRFYDFPGNLEVMERLWQTGVLDGFEFQCVAEWDARHPPRDEGQRRYAYWADSDRHTTDQIAAALQASGLPLLSVHANRDVGICLCSGQPELIAEGRQLMHESLALAERVGAQVCVFHFWDTWKEDIDPAALCAAMVEIAPQYPTVKAAVENVPTHLPGATPYDLCAMFPWITLDWRWAAVYDEWERFAVVGGRIVNMHLHGLVRERRWTLDPDWPLSKRLDFYRALEAVRDEWGYAGLLTVERVPPDVQWGDFVAAIASLEGER
jgi:sugar phosphate isomerase/epimerase